MRSRLALALALAAGLAIGWVDSRPGWDATGLTVLALLVAAGVASSIAPKRALAVAVLVGLPTPLLELGNDAALAALGFAVAGSLLGVAVGRASAREAAGGH